jgi:HK97 family phage major capsid protein
MQLTIKELTSEGDLILEGYGVMFDVQDLDGEFFTKETNFYLENFERLPVLYGHNQKEIRGVIGKATVEKVDDVGILFNIIIDRASRYKELVKKLVEMGKLGLSSGTAEQFFSKEANMIKEWGLVELSLTETPAEPRTILTLEEVAKIKQIEEEILQGSSEEGVETSEELSVEETEFVKDVIEFNEIKVIGDNKMEDVKEGGNVEDSRMKSIEDTLQRIMDVIEKTPAAKAGYVTADGGTADKHIKSFGDFLVAVRRNDADRLTKVYGTTKDLGESPGSAGGYLVPTEYGTQLIQAAAFENPVYSRVQRIPVMRESGTYPALDQYFTPTAGSGETAFAGGVKASFTDAGAEFTETQPAFSTLNWRLNKMGGVTEVENELIEDSPFAIEALLRGLFQVAISARNERNILRGSGVGEPLGILNAASAIGVSDNTTGSFKWEDVGAMYARFKGMGGSPVWIVHPSVWPKIMTMNNSSVSVVQTNLNSGTPNTINGFPVITSEHMPQIGNNGAVLLADLTAYVMFEKAGLSISYSEHVGFKRDVGVWKFRIRNDGKPWLQAPVILSDINGSYSVSSFVYLVND